MQKPEIRHSLATMMKAILFLVYFVVLPSAKLKVLIFATKLLQKENENSITYARRGMSTLLSRHVEIKKLSQWP